MVRWNISGLVGGELLSDYNIIWVGKSHIAELMRALFKTIKFAFGLPKFDASKDYYKPLNLSPEASQEQIKKAFKQLAKQYHPDVNKGKEELFKQINEAYQVLSEAQTRKQYDQSRVKPQQTAHNPQHRTHSSSTQSDFKEPRYEQYQQRRQQNYNQRQEQPISQAQFRQRMRRQHEQAMRRAASHRQNYDDLGRSYDNYDRFAQDVLRKKAEKFTQKDKVTQESVRKQEEIKRADMKRREEEEFQRKREALKQSIQEKYQRAMHNNENMMEGIKQMGQFVKNIFKKK